MTATADMILERRKIRRKLAFWRILAIIALVLAVLAFLPMRGGGGGGKAHVARIDITGVITDDAERREAIEKIADNDNARALVVRIASPGGTVVGSEALHESLRKVAEKKPVVALVGEIAASGGYAAAIAAERIFVRRNSITGSIGVVSQVPDVTGLMERIGVSVREVKSSPLKAAPSPVSEDTEAAFDALEGLILDSYAWFRDLVGARRGLEGAALERVSDGRVFTGRQAMELGLVDQIGAEAEARAWLAEAHEIGAGLPVRDYRWGRADLPFPLDLFEDMSARFLPEAPVTLSPGPRLMALYTG
mgnify:FL=1